jgi:hypothetical protein
MPSFSFSYSPQPFFLASPLCNPMVESCFWRVRAKKVGSGLSVAKHSIGFLHPLLLLLNSKHYRVFVTE